MEKLLFKNSEEYLNWAKDQDWYQYISLSCGYKTPGNIDSEKRIDIFKQYDFQGKRVLDIGCNSGLYCFMAKRLGAKEVIGIDIFDKRLEQARIIAANEQLDITFLNRSIDNISDLGTFDIVICIAVLTEIPDLLGAIEIIKQKTGEVAFIEMDIASPTIYIPSFQNLKRLFRGKDSLNVFAEGRKHKKGWMISPSMGLLKNLFGHKFRIKNLGKNLRYQLLEIKRIDT